MFKKLFSRKLLVTILVPIAMVINAKLANPLDEATVHNIVYVVIAYIIGQSAVDLKNS